MKEPQNLWKDLVNRFAQQSKCKSRQVGCIIVKENHVIAEGWNGAPSKSSCDECPRPKCKGESQASGTALDLAICSHAEANAIGNCAKRGVATQGAYLYCTTFPCAECAKLIVAAGITRVCYDVEYPAELSRQIFKNAGVGLCQFDGPLLELENVLNHG